MVKEINGKAISAKIVFSSAIGFFKDHFMTALDEKQFGIQKDRIHWVLSIPAIWNDSCKKFMRESAIQVCNILNIVKININCKQQPIIDSKLCYRWP